MPRDEATGGRWWKHTTVYQIYPRSFADASGDGVGDLEGIRRHLDHLERLGVETLWLSPIYPSPMADFGYDVSDFCAIDPIFGDLTVFDRLLADVHGRNMRLVLDWVPNHTSDAHEWFVDARSSRESPRRDFYTWHDPAPDGGPPNNWRAALVDAPAWTFDEASGQYYLHLFLPEQPDLNWANPEVEAAMHDTLRFWLDRGVDGFRADVVQCIGKDPTLLDDPPELVGLPRCAMHVDAETHPLLRRIRTLLDSYPQQPMMVGEVSILDLDLMVPYLGAGDELHLAFNFESLHLPWDAARWRAAVVHVEAAHAAVGGWPTWVLSNHDLPRHRTRYANFPNTPVDTRGSEERARAAAVLLLTLRGTPFVYQGEELGLLDAEVPPDRVVDPGGRDGCRAPIPWDGSPEHGWHDPWLPLPPEADVRNVEAASADPGSMLELYRSLLALRAVTPALIDGELELLDAPEGVLTYRRTVVDSSDVTVLVSMVDEPVDITGVSGTLLIDSLAASPPGSPFGSGSPESDGTSEFSRLAPRQALIIRT